MHAIVARAQVAMPPAQLYALLADLTEHWRIAGPWVEPLELGDDGGRVRLRGPLGIRRTVHTALREREPDRRLAGVACAGGTHAAIAWQLEACGHGTLVTLRADVTHAAPLDRLLLAAGGRRWLTSRFARTLGRLTA